MKGPILLNSFSFNLKFITFDHLKEMYLFPPLTFDVNIFPFGGLQFIIFIYPSLMFVYLYFAFYSQFLKHVSVRSCVDLRYQINPRTGSIHPMDLLILNHLQG